MAETVPFITAEDVEDRLDWLDLVAAIKAGHRGPAAELGDQFLRRGSDTLLSRAAWIDGQGIAVKSMSVFPGNRDLPSIQGAVLLFDDTNGRVEAVIEGQLVTKWKTAGDSLTGASYLARKDSTSLLIVGAGTVAGSLIEAYRALFPEIEITIWNRTMARAEQLAAVHDGVTVEADLSVAVGQADIIATCTMSACPVLNGEWLRPGQHLDMIGAYREDMREGDDAVILRSRIFVDSRETTVPHIGEIKTPISAGLISESDVLGDLYDLEADRAGRQSDDDITLFKNGGGAHLDLMTARMILTAYRS